MLILVRNRRWALTAARGSTCAAVLDSAINQLN